MKKPVLTGTTKVLLIPDYVSLVLPLPRGTRYIKYRQKLYRRKYHDTFALVSKDEMYVVEDYRKPLPPPQFPHKSWHTRVKEFKDPVFVTSPRGVISPADVEADLQPFISVPHGELSYWVFEGACGRLFLDRYMRRGAELHHSDPSPPVPQP